MTPAARVAAAIDVLDAVLAGAAAEKALTNWARSSRYAGSGDRAAVRDLVFSALRRLRSAAWLGGAMTGRGVMIGLLRQQGDDPAALFTGARYAPAPLSPAEAGAGAFGLDDAPRAVRLDCQDWLMPVFDADLGDAAEAVLAAMRNRAPVFLRVNLARTDVNAAAVALAAEGIVTRPGPLATTALEVTDGARRVAQSRAFQDGLVELQDAASQAVVAELALSDGQTVLDYCAGGGGKTLAMAGLWRLKLAAHDIDPERLKPLAERARRAGVTVDMLTTPQLAGRLFELVLCDVPCSGSGAWRRSPQGKWLLGAERLEELCQVQAGILARAARLVRPGGRLAYVTCSLFAQENRAQVDRFLSEHSGWKLDRDRQFTPLDGGDGFYLALLTRD